MAQWLKQSTAITIKHGPYLDEDDGKTAETGLTISQADVRLSKNGGNFAQKNDATSATHDEFGWYDIALDATDTGTLGRLIVAVAESGALPVWREFMVVPSNEYDSLISGTDDLEVDTIAISGDTGAADNAELDYDGTGYAKANSTIGTTTTNTDMRGTDNAALAATALSTAQWTNARAGYLDNLNGHVAQTGDSFARLGAPAAASVSADILAIDNFVDNLETRLGTPGDLGGGATVADNLADMAGATFATGTDSLEAIRDRGDAAWVTGAGTGLTALATGTAQGGSASTIQLAAGHTFANNELNGNVVKLLTGTGAGQSRLITSYTGATDTASISPNWTTNPDATTTYEVVNGPVNVVQIEGGDATDQIRDAVVDDATRIDASQLNILSGNDPGAQIASQADVTGLNDPTAAAIAAAVWVVVAEGAHTYADIQRITLAVLAGKSTGGGTATISFRDEADAKNRVQATVDANGNRTAIGTLDGT
jgi:hypothetical protein